MPANFRAIMSEVPRPLEVAQRDAEGQRTSRPGRRKLSEREVARRAEPLLAMVASGDIPVDNHAAQVIRAYVEHARHAIEK